MDGKIQREFKHSSSFVHPKIDEKLAEILWTIKLNFWTLYQNNDRNMSCSIFNCDLKVLPNDDLSAKLNIYQRSFEKFGLEHGKQIKGWFIIHVITSCNCSQIASSSELRIIKLVILGHLYRNCHQKREHWSPMEPLNLLTIAQRKWKNKITTMYQLVARKSMA